LVVADAASIPTAANTGLLTLVIGANILCGLALPIVLLPQSGYWLLLLIPFTALTVAHWALIHEAVHGHLHPRHRVNEALGRLLGVLFGGSFAVLRFGHLSHHTLNSRPSERAELYDPAAVPRWRATVAFYLRLFWGLYLAEFLSSLVCFLPRRPWAPSCAGCSTRGRTTPAAWRSARSASYWSRASSRASASTAAWRSAGSRHA
jgi:fatty acid desaturase